MSTLHDTAAPSDIGGCVGAERLDRRAIVERHNVRLLRADPALALTVGNGDFGYTADITGMQSFLAFHDPRTVVGSDLSEIERGQGRNIVNTATMTNWGWHEMPTETAFSLDEAMSGYTTHRGTVEYPDVTDHDAMLEGRQAADPTRRAGNWLHSNPHRLDLGRIGLELRSSPAAEPEVDPSVLDEPEQTLDLWTGRLHSSFGYRAHSIDVATTSDPAESLVAFRMEGDLLTSGFASVVIRFPYASDHFMGTSDWDSPERHHTSISAQTSKSALIVRVIDDTTYRVCLRWNVGVLERTGDHAFVLRPETSNLELTVEFVPEGAEVGAPKTAEEIERAASTAWESFWMSGAALDLSESSDPRASELERRIVLSQYLTQVNCSGVLPPQETGLVTNSWQGKFHLEMHWWHSIHFAAWGRPDRLSRSLQWYLDVLPSARATARRQGYAGARWPKQVGPDGRESPSDIGSLIIWQQPHLLYMLDMLVRARPDGAVGLVRRFAGAIEDTADFMADFAQQRDGSFHLPSPLMPAQEFYDPRTTEDPTFELAYWVWALETAQRLRALIGLPPVARWRQVAHGLVEPRRLDRSGTYAAIGTPPFLRRDDHPAMLLAFGFVPSTRLIDPRVMEATLAETWEHWDWDSAWGWDYPAMAMTATRVGRPDLAVEALLLDARKNVFLASGQNQQMPSFLPIYLPGNGALLAAVSLMVGGWAGAREIPGFPDDGRWVVRHEGFLAWPA